MAFASRLTCETPLELDENLRIREIPFAELLKATE